MERFIENAMYASRWILAPIYFGLSLGLLALASWAAVLALGRGRRATI